MCCGLGLTALLCLVTHTTSLNRAGSSTTNTGSQPYKDRGKQAFAHKWKSSLPADENRQASKTSIPLHRRYNASSQQGKCCEHEVPSSARLDRMVACCPIYTKLSCSSGGRGWGCGWGGMVRAFSNGVGVWGGGCTSCPSPCRLHIRIISLFWY